MDGNPLSWGLVIALIAAFLVMQTVGLLLLIEVNNKLEDIQYVQLNAR